VPPKPDAARAGEGGRDERDYRLKIAFRTEEIVAFFATRRDAPRRARCDVLPDHRVARRFPIDSSGRDALEWIGVGAHFSSIRCASWNS
jgi:hypothetical protein